jgi:lysophospholipase L1-like esterase
VTSHGFWRRAAPWLPHSPARRAVFLGVYAMFLVGLVWLGFKVFWSVRAGVPLNEQPVVWDIYYPQLRRSGVMQADLRRDDGSFDVLMLGASVIDPSFGSMEAQLRKRLEERLAGKARVFNLATSAHTTRDSRNKYEYLTGKHFDLVLVYHAINDVRMNNCRPGTFREDYTHCAWYSSFERRLARGTMSLPLSEQAQSIGQMIGLGEASENLRQHGGDIKTPPAFRKNLERILDLSRERKAKLLLISFAWHIPDNYSPESFAARTLDYSHDLRSCGVEMWGEPDNVRKTLDAHNGVVRTLAKENADVLFADVEAAVPRRGEFFIDPCHLTEAGCRRWVDAVWPEIEKALP